MASFIGGGNRSKQSLLPYLRVLLFINILYAKVDILLTRGKHLKDHINSVRGEVWDHKTRLAPPLFIELPVPSDEFERSCICLLVVSILLLFL